jgi:hypothetical protein
MNKSITRYVVFKCFIMHTIYVGVHYCNHDTIPRGYPQVLFGLWSSLFLMYSHSFSLRNSRAVWN